MKLFHDSSNAVEVSLIEESADSNGKKNLFIEGIFMQAGIVNRNGRLYENKILEPAVEKYKKNQIDNGRAVGELGHPSTPVINLDRVSHRITALEFKGNDVYGKAQILETPMGMVVKGLIDGGVKIGVSSRGMGNLVKKNGTMYVEDGYELATIDIVQDPSAPSAFVNGIMEGKEWVWENGILKEQEIENYETEVKRKHNSMTELRLWADFLSKLSNTQKTKQRN